VPETSPIGATTYFNPSSLDRRAQRNTRAERKRATTGHPGFFLFFFSPSWRKTPQSPQITCDTDAWATTSGLRVTFSGPRRGDRHSDDRQYDKRVFGSSPILASSPKIPEIAKPILSVEPFPYKKRNEISRRQKNTHPRTFAFFLPTKFSRVACWHDTPRKEYVDPTTIPPPKWTLTYAQNVRHVDRPLRNEREKDGPNTPLLKQLTPILVGSVQYAVHGILAPSRPGTELSERVRRETPS